MKQATGKTKFSELQNQVSIQLTLSGHSFSAGAQTVSPEAYIENGSAPVEVTVLTDKTLLVPQEEFSTETAEAYLRIAGKGCTRNETPVWSDSKRPVVALMAADAESVITLRAKAGDRLRFTSPLLAEHEYPEATVWFYADGPLLFIKVYDSGLQFAESAAYEDTAGLCYLLERLHAAFGLSRFTAVITGGKSSDLRKAAKPYFKRTVCA